jgi:two-component system sensor histidine kinase DesK
MPVAQSPSRFRLLPEKRTLGWVPYAWLVYLGTLFVQPIIERWSTTLWLVTIAGTFAFVLSYFRGFWERGSRLVAIVAFQTALGIGFSWINHGSAVFFIYAASFAGQLDRPRDAARLIVAITAISAATAWVVDAPLYYWVATMVFTPLIGGINLHYRQVEKTNADLRRAHAEIERLAAVAERERIARDLHDVLGHTLSLVILKSQLASKVIELDAVRAAKEIREVEQIARTAMSEVRETIRGYRATLDHEIAQARALLDAAGITGEFTVALSTPNVDRDEVLAFVLREGVTNVVRHSGAAICRVRVNEATTGCTLTIEDDGRGAVLAQGNGLRGMRERVTAAGGTLSFESTSGTRLTVTLPGVTTGSAEHVPLRVVAQRAAG